MKNRFYWVALSSINPVLQGKQFTCEVGSCFPSVFSVIGSVDPELSQLCICDFRVGFLFF